MVRCTLFYNIFERDGNFCDKSDAVASEIERYISYTKRHNIKDYIINNGALQPLIMIEDLNDGVVHDIVLKKLMAIIEPKKRSKSKSKSKRKYRVKTPKVRITRRFVIEMINNVNTEVGIVHKLDKIPFIRVKMGIFEHDIGNISYETRNRFEDIKDGIAVTNDGAMKLILEYCNSNGFKDWVETKKSNSNIEIIKSA